MRDRERDTDHEREWGSELERAQSPAVDRYAKDAELRLRDGGGNVADLRAAWAEFARDNPMEGEIFQRDFVRAQNLAYARVVDDLLRHDGGDGFCEQHVNQDDKPSRHELFVSAAVPQEPRAGTPEREGANNTDGRDPPLAPGPREVDAARETDWERIVALERAVRSAKDPAESLRAEAALEKAERAWNADPHVVARQLGKEREVAQMMEERRVVQAEVQERIVRSQERPEDAYLLRARLLETFNPRDFAAVSREVSRLNGLPQLQTREATTVAVRHTADALAVARAAAAAQEPQLRTRLYALALINEVRAREETEKLLRALPKAPSPMERSRPMPARSVEREITTGSKPLIKLFQVADTAPHAFERAAATTSGDVFADARTANRDDSTEPGRSHAQAPGPEDGREIDISTRDVFEERPDSRETPDVEATLNKRLSPDYRTRAYSIERQLAGVAANADRELFRRREVAENDPMEAREVMEVDRAIGRILAKPRSHDPLELAAKVHELAERERSDPDITDGSLRAERLAFASLARDAYERQSELLRAVQKDLIEEVRELPKDERAEMMRESAILLREPAYNDRAAMNRELLRRDTDRLAQHCAIARRAPSIAELEQNAKWRGAAFQDRIERRVREHLLSPELDEELIRALAEVRVRAALVTGTVEYRLALDEAIELAELVRRLPIARSLEVDTPPTRYRNQAT